MRDKLSPCCQPGLLHSMVASGSLKHPYVAQDSKRECSKRPTWELPVPIKLFSELARHRILLVKAVTGHPQMQEEEKSTSPKRTVKEFVTILNPRACSV